jgi:hypothetical protein
VTGTGWGHEILSLIYKSHHPSAGRSTVRRVQFMNFLYKCTRATTSRPDPMGRRDQFFFGICPTQEQGHVTIHQSTASTGQTSKYHQHFSAIDYVHSDNSGSKNVVKILIIMRFSLFLGSRDWFLMIMSISLFQWHVMSIVG